MPDIRIATIGSSAITERFIDALAKVDGVSYAAAYSRDLTRARAFGEPRGATCFFDSKSIFMIFILSAFSETK